MNKYTYYMILTLLIFILCMSFLITISNVKENEIELKKLEYINSKYLNRKDFLKYKYEIENDIYILKKEIDQLNIDLKCYYDNTKDDWIVGKTTTEIDSILLNQ